MIPKRPSAQARHRISDRARKIADGSWTEHETTGTGFPKVFYLKYDMYRNAWPLLALATYRKILNRAGKQQHANGVLNGSVNGSNLKIAARV